MAVGTGIPPPADMAGAAGAGSMLSDADSDAGSEAGSEAGAGAGSGTEDDSVAAEGGAAPDGPASRLPVPGPEVPDEVAVDVVVGVDDDVDDGDSAAPQARVAPTAMIRNIASRVALMVPIC